MTATTLLRELESLTHDARMRRMVELGQAARTDPTSAALLDTLEKGDFHERLLALQSCYGSQDATRALRALTDPSRTLQSRAKPLVVRFAADAEVCQVLRAARERQRLALLPLLRRQQRQAAIDAFLVELATSDPAALPLLLPFGSRSLVEHHFTAARQLGGDVFWRRLVKGHPDLAAEILTSELTAASALDARLIHEATTVLTLLADRHPVLALPLARALLGQVPLLRVLGGLSTLARRCPREVADLLLASTDNVLIALDIVAWRLDLARLHALLERRPSTLTQPTVWFHRLPPDVRSRLFLALPRQWRDAEGCLTPQLVAALPGSLRTEEARRNLALSAQATRPVQRLPYAAFLPWDEALATLEPWIKHPDGELRALALQTLAGSVRYQRGRLGELLLFFRLRKHEQDPVRCRMLAGLAELPPSAWQTDHLDNLSQLLRDALSAADLSAATASHAQRLVVALLRFHPDWAAGWLATLVQERGQLHLGNLQNVLNDADVFRLAPVLLPVLRSWQNRERQGQLASFAQSLGRRIRAFDGLAELLEHEIEVSRTQWTAEYLLALLANHDKERFAALVPRLVESDRSWATRAVVYEYMHRRRQDLLTPFLGQQAYSGRFSTGRTRFVLPFQRGFFRWTSEQRTIFQKVLDEITRTSKERHDTPALLQVVGQLAALPEVEVALLSRLAADPRPAIQEGTLRVLGRLDAGQGVPILLEALGDQRARVAIYALRGAVLALPPDQAVTLLRGVKLDKVTVAKECVRLLGDLAGDAAFGELQRLDGAKLHRDVRGALLRALWGHLDRPASWAILERTVDSPDPALLDSVVRIPTDRLSTTARQRLLGVLRRLVDHPAPLIRLQVLQRLVNLPIADPDLLLLPALLEKLASALPDERQAAALALVGTCRVEDAELIGAAFTRLLPRRRALQEAVQALRAAVGGDRRRLGPVARAVLTALRADPLTAALRIGLAIETLSWQELVEVLEQMSAGNELYHGVLDAALNTLNNWVRRTDNADLAHLEAKLAGQGDERLRRLALAALVVQAALPEGWSEMRLNRLFSYRADVSPLVAAAAQFTLPGEEDADRVQD